MTTRGRKATGKTTISRCISFPQEVYAQLERLALVNNRNFSNMVVHLAMTGMEHAPELRREQPEAK